jgi:hypothetical protein
MFFSESYPRQRHGYHAIVTTSSLRIYNIITLNDYYYRIRNRKYRLTWKSDRVFHLATVFLNLSISLYNQLLKGIHFHLDTLKNLRLPLPKTAY